MTADYTLRPIWMAVSIAVALLLTACGKPSGADAIAQAKTFMVRNENSAAQVTLKAALQKQPESAPLRFLLGKSLQAGGDPSTALVELRKALEMGHSDAEVLPELVKAMAATGQAEAATKQYADKQLDDRLAMAELQMALASAWAAQGRKEAVQQAVDKALELNPVNTMAQLTKAQLFAVAGDLEAADRLNNKVLEREPKNAQALHMKGRVLRYARRDMPGAMAAQRAALEANPKLIAAHGELLDMLFVAQDKKGMRVQLAAMQNAVPQNINTFLFRAQIEFLDNNLRAARELVQQMLRMRRPDPRALILAAKIELSGGAPTLAETYLLRVLSDEPDQIPARELLTRTYLRLGDSAKALTFVQPLIERANAPARFFALAADAQLQAGHPALAQALFERAAKLGPENLQLRTGVAVARVAQGQVAEGLADLGRIAESDAGTTADLALIAAQIARKDVKGALASVDRVDRKQPNQARFANIRGQLLMQSKDVAAARKNFARALELDPLFFPAAVALASLDAADNKMGDAKKYFESMLARDAKNWRAMLALADLHTNSGEPGSKILLLLQEAIKGNPTVAEPRVALIEFHLAARQHEAALSVAQEALTALPDSPALLDGLGRAQLGAKAYQQAITTFRKLVNLAPGLVQPHLQLADIYLARNERAAALASLQRALDISPDLVGAQAKQVEILLAGKQTKEALAIARRLQQKNPRDGTGHALEASVLMTLKQWDGAATALRSAMSRTPSTDSAVRLHAVLIKAGKAVDADKLATSWTGQWPKDTKFRAYLGIAAMNAKDWPRAERLYREVVVLQPTDVIANNNLAWALMNQNKSGGLPFAEAANKQAPNNPALMDTLAAALADAGQVASALALQSKVVEMAPQLMAAKLTLARIAIQAGNKALARDQLDKLTYEGDKFPAQAEVQVLLRSAQ